MRASVLSLSALAAGLLCGCEPERAPAGCVDLGGEVSLTSVSGGSPALAPGKVTCDVLATAGDSVRSLVSGGTSLFSIAIAAKDALGTKQPAAASEVPAAGQFTLQLTLLPADPNAVPSCVYRYFTDGSGGGSLKVTELGDAPGQAFAGTLQQVALAGEVTGPDGGPAHPACAPAAPAVVDGDFVAPMAR